MNPTWLGFSGMALQRIHFLHQPPEWPDRPYRGTDTPLFARTRATGHIEEQTRRGTNAPPVAVVARLYELRRTDAPRNRCAGRPPVVAGLDPATHGLAAAPSRTVDARVKPGHDEL
jgi:hypothetical protein